MILRQGVNFAVHAAGGMAMGIGLVVAGAMLIRLAERRTVDSLTGRARDMGERFSGMASEPNAAPPPEH